MDYSFILVIAIIMLSTKVLGLASEKVNMPQVVGALIAGLLLGPSCFGLIGESDFLVKTAEIGVIILMFTAGLDTDVQELKHTGLSAFIIATIGVIVPFLGGAGCYLLFNGEPDSLRMLKAAFIGVILTATSVSITVETLREMGKLKSRVGTAIMAAAVIDDVLGIIVLTVLTGFTDSTVQPVTIFIRIIAYFICLAIVAIVMGSIPVRVIKKPLRICAQGSGAITDALPYTRLHSASSSALFPSTFSALPTSPALTLPDLCSATTARREPML